MVLCRFTRGTQGFNARSFADKPCVARRHSRMRAVAVGLLSLRHVHFVHQVHQVHLAKCFVTRLAPQLLIVNRVSGSVCLQGLIASPCSAVSPQGKTALSRCRRSAPVAPGGGVGPVARRSGWLKKCGKMFRKSPRFSAERFSKSFATVCPRGEDNCFVPQQFSSPS